MADPINPSVAAGLYQNAQNATKGVKAEGNDGPSFGDLMYKATSDSIRAMKAGEKATAEAVTGQADLTDVVEAVTAAELTLQTVVAVRDRMMSAYQEIMRMPIQVLCTVILCSCTISV